MLGIVRQGGGIRIENSRFGEVGNIRLKILEWLSSPVYNRLQIILYTVNIFYYIYSKDFIACLMGIMIVFITFMTFRSYMKSFLIGLYQIFVVDRNPELINKEIELKIMELMKIWNVNHLKINKKASKERDKIIKKIKQRVDVNG